MLDLFRVDLFRERSGLLTKKLDGGGLNSRERRRLRVILKLLDRNDMIMHEYSLKRIERRIWWSRAGIN